MEYLWSILEQTQKLIYKNIDYRFINLRRSRTGIKVNTRRNNPLTNIKKYSFSLGQKSSDLLRKISQIISHPNHFIQHWISIWTDPMQDIIPRSADSLFKKHVPRSFSTIERFPKVQFLFQPLPPPCPKIPRNATIYRESWDAKRGSDEVGIRREERISQSSRRVWPRRETSSPPSSHRWFVGSREIYTQPG